MSIKITIKNSGTAYPLELNLADTLGVLKKEIYEQTKIPIERQKILIRGQFNDDTLIQDLNLKPNQVIMVLGSPELNLPVAPVNSSFDEDNKEEEVIKHPIGLENLGNTCYLNSTVQALYNIPIVKDLILNSDKVGEIGSNEHLTLQLKRVFQTLDEKKYESCTPNNLITSLRYKYPQFNERDQFGNFKQQDAEEVFTQILLSLQNVLGDDFISNFKILFKSTVKNLEDASEVEERFDEDLKLQCHISGTTNFVKNGIIDSLNETIEKHSQTLNKNCQFEINKKITKLPKVLTVQFVRFFWKRSTNKKSKILRKVQFPFQLDLSDLLDPAYRDSKIKIRDELRLLEKEYQLETHDFKKQKKSKKDEEIFNTKLSKEFLEKYKSKFPNDLSKGENPSSLYSLTGIITHQGSSADSGHYQAFIRDKIDENKWWRFNDDKISVVDNEKIESLAGGGESDSALILLYKGFGLE